MKPVIHVHQLSKRFKVRESRSTFKGGVRNFFSPKHRLVWAIHDVSFSVNEGERVAFIGPNGAGKSTTIKILTGILYPDSGTVQVLGMVPWKDRKKLSYHFGTVFGQRTQLWYRLPPSSTFRLLSKIYDLPPKTYLPWLEELVELFQIKPFLHKPVYQLSLGQRMRAEIVASLLHQPKILFLDEPTIGLDVNAKLIIRDMLTRLSIEKKTTLFLTSHDPTDIEQICERAIILDDGVLIRDQPIKELKNSYVKKKILTLNIESEKLILDLPGIQIIKETSHQLVLEVDLEVISIEAVIQEVLKKTGLKDLTIENPQMEEILRAVYKVTKKD